MPPEKGKAKKPAVFDLKLYSAEQVMEALNCPVNRHCTRVEHDCTDWDLQLHPEWLIQHYIENGGAVAFAQKRKDFIRLCDSIETCAFADICNLSKVASGWRLCPIRGIGKICLECSRAKKFIEDEAVPEEPGQTDLTKTA
jgi:hypothetical protein